MISLHFLTFCKCDLLCLSYCLGLNFLFGEAGEQNEAKYSYLMFDAYKISFPTYPSFVILLTFSVFRHCILEPYQAEVNKCLLVFVFHKYFEMTLLYQSLHQKKRGGKRDKVPVLIEFSLVGEVDI